jgi:hypothetical protein
MPESVPARPTWGGRSLIATLALSSLCLATAGCGTPARSGALIDHYRDASCVWPSSVTNREWDEILKIGDGSVIRIRGECGAGGGVAIANGVEGPLQIAVRPPDYLCPRDVRIDDRRLVLYVKAQGVAAIMGFQTWLYEYDLRRRRVSDSLLVDPSALPPDCPNDPLHERSNAAK